MVKIEVSRIKKILLERACREIESLDKAGFYGSSNPTVRIQRLAYADQLILILGDFNNQLADADISVVREILGQLYSHVNEGKSISGDAKKFMDAFYEAKRKSVVFPSVEIIEKAIERWSYCIS